MKYEDIKKRIEEIKKKKADIVGNYELALKEINFKLIELEEKKKNTEKFLRENCKDLTEIRKKHFSFPFTYYPGGGGGNSNQRNYLEPETLFVTREELFKMTNNLTNFEKIEMGRGYVIEIVS